MATESDARTRVVGYLDRRGTDIRYADLIHWIHFSVNTESVDLSMSDLRDVLADADRDHRFAEAVRRMLAAYARGEASLGAVGVTALQAEIEFYSTPCTASASSASVKEEEK